MRFIAVRVVHPPICSIEAISLSEVSNNTPAKASFPKVKEVSINIVGITISLAGIAKM